MGAIDRVVADGAALTDQYTGADRRQTPLQPAPSSPWWVLPGLAWFVLVIFAAIAGASFFTEDTTLRTQTANTWANLAIAVVAYWYGSSAGKTRTDDALAVTSLKQNETIAAQGQALAGSAPVAPLAATAETEPPVEVPVQPPPAKA